MDEFQQQQLAEFLGENWARFVNFMEERCASEGEAEQQAEEIRNKLKQAS